MTCARHYGISQISCSGHGTCVESKCYCDSGWTSRADSQVSYTYDCDINILYMKIFGGINFVLCIVIVLIFVSRLYRFPPKDINPRNISQISFLIAYFGIGVYHAGKLIDPIHFVLSSNSPNAIPLSIGFGLFVVFIPFGMTGYLARLINFLRGYSRMMSTEALVRINKRISYIYILVPILIIAAFVLLVMIIVSLFYQSIASIMFRTGLAGGIATIFFAFGLIVTFIIQGVLTELKFSVTSTSTTANRTTNNNSNDEVKRAYTKLLSLQHVIFYSLTCFCGPVSESFGLWYYLTRKYDYFFPILTFVASIGLLSAVINIKPKKSDDIINTNDNIEDNKTSFFNKTFKAFKTFKSKKNKQLFVSSVEIHPFDPTPLPDTS